MNFYVLHEQNYRVKPHKFPREKLIFDHAMGAWLQTSRGGEKSNYLFPRKEREDFQIYGSFGFMLCGLVVLNLLFLSSCEMDTA